MFGYFQAYCITDLHDLIYCYFLINPKLNNKKSETHESYESLLIYSILFCVIIICQSVSNACLLKCN